MGFLEAQEDLTLSAINRAEAINPIINAIVTKNYEKALTQAKSIDKNPKFLEASALAGFPFLIKDFHLWMLSSRFLLQAFRSF